MQATSPDAPSFPSYAYFSRPPRWARDLTGVIASLLFLFGVMGLTLQAGETAAREFDKVDSALEEPGAKPQASDSPAVPATLFEAPGNFRADFPTEPLKRTRTLSDEGLLVDVTSYMAIVDDGMYLVATIPLAAGVPFSLEAAGEGMAEEFDGTLRSSVATTFRGFPAQEVVIETEDGIVREIAVRAADRIFQIGVAGEDEAAYTRFRDSLEIL